jgi:hypothetical protein
MTALGIASVWRCPSHILGSPESGRARYIRHVGKVPTSDTSETEEAATRWVIGE